MRWMSGVSARRCAVPIGADGYLDGAQRHVETVGDKLLGLHEDRHGRDVLAIPGILTVALVDQRFD
jgi:hypothetical protein